MHKETPHAQSEANRGGLYLRAFMKIPEARIKNPLKGKSDYGWHFEQNIYSKDSECRSLKAGEGSGNMPKVIVPEATKQGYAIAEEGDSINLTCPDSKTRRGRVGKGQANTLDTATQQYALNQGRIRRLTPTECERLQGFPDGWTDGISDSQRYKVLGNAVTTNVVTEIFRRLYE